MGRRWVRFHLAVSGTAVLTMVVFAVAGLAVPSLVASAAGIGTAALANYPLADQVVFRPVDPGGGSGSSSTTVARWSRP